jgi:hypothetical protein
MPDHPPAELTDDTRCPYCEAEGAKKVPQNRCQRHDWGYRRWFENMQTGVMR